MAQTECCAATASATLEHADDVIDDVDEHIHCIDCISPTCKSSSCQTVHCPHCHVLLHQCKLVDHCAEICPLAVVRCINAENGCFREMKRWKINEHLQHCLASVVVCTRERNRKTLTSERKLMLKKAGKSGRRVTDKTSDAPDLQLTYRDQDVICSSYKYRRSARVRRRDQRHPSHPPLPLREILSEDNDESEAWVDADADSSDDERRQKKEKRDRCLKMFSGCTTCMVDPTVQHLHTLGNLETPDAPKTLGKLPVTAKADAFHTDLDLMISNNIESFSELNRKDDNNPEVRKGFSLFTFKCLHVVKRSEVENHYLSQHLYESDNFVDLIVRCPNWSSGCLFHTSRFSSSSSLVYSRDMDAFKFKPKQQQDLPVNSSDNLLESIPVWLLARLAEYLSTSALFNLAKTSRTLKRTVFAACEERCYVDRKWIKVGGKWIRRSPTLYIGISEKPPARSVRVPVELSEHIPKCEYFMPVDYTDKDRVPCFPTEILREINDEFDVYTATRGDAFIPRW